MDGAINAIKYAHVQLVILHTANEVFLTLCGKRSLTTAKLTGPTLEAKNTMKTQVTITMDTVFAELWTKVPRRVLWENFFDISIAAPEAKKLSRVNSALIKYGLDKGKIMVL